MSKKILNTYTDDESAFIARVTDLPLSAAAVRAALRQWAEGQLGEGVGDLFLPRERGANLKAINADSERKRQAAIKRWAKNRIPPV